MPFFLEQCEALIIDAKRWDFLFTINAQDALSITKKWIQSYAIYCKKLNEEIVKRMNLDQEKIDLFSKIVIDEYKNSSIVSELAEIRKFNAETDSGLKFIHICHNIGNLPKRWFIKDDDSHPDHIFNNFGRSIAREERVYVLETIKKTDSIEIISLRENNTAAVFDKIKYIFSQMRNSGHNPSVIFLPLELTKKFVLDHHSNYRILKIDDIFSLKIVNSSNQWPFEEIVILDKTAGLWTYKPINNSEERVSVEITPEEDNESTMKILVQTTVNYSIVKPDAVKKVKFDISVVPSSP